MRSDVPVGYVEDRGALLVLAERGVPRPVLAHEVEAWENRLDGFLDSLGEEAYPSQHDVNLLELKNGEVEMGF